MTHLERPSRLHHSSARAPLILALEQRFMFDGAAAVEAAKDTHPDAVAAIAPPAIPAERKEVAFIDTAITDWQVLAGGVRDGVEVVLIESGRSGLETMAQWGTAHSGYDAIHVFSHGSAGFLSLGTDSVTAEMLSGAGPQADLAALGQALKSDGDLKIYGCSVAAGDTGQSFIATLADITAADVAASDDLTGAASKGGDWTLERTTGQVDSSEVPLSSGIDYDGVLTLANPSTSFSAITATTFQNTAALNGSPVTQTVTDLASTGWDIISTTPAGSPSVMQIRGFTSIGNGDSTSVRVTGDKSVIEFRVNQNFTFDFTQIDVRTSGTGTVRITALDSSFNTTGTPLDTAIGSSGTFITTTSASGNNSFNDISGIRIEFVSPSQDNMAPYFDNLIVTDIKVPSSGPTVTSATYDASTNTLVVTGTGMTATGGVTNDIDVSKLTLTGQGGATYTLTSSSVEIDSATQFTVVLNAADQINVEGLLNKNLTASVGGTTYNIAAAADWNPANAGNADTTGNGVTVSSVQTPTVTSATYDANTGALVVTGTNMVKASGATNDITANTLTLTGEGGATYTLTDTANVEITDASSFTLTLSATDKAALNQIFNKTGTASTGGTTYNVAAADDWNTVITNGDISDATNAVTVANPDTPAITSATYDAGTGALVVTGTGFLKLSGATNDIDVSKLTISGEGGATYQLTTSSVEITNGTTFTVTLSATDLAAVNQMLNKAGTSATGTATYNLAAAEDWAAGAAAAVNVADTTGNGITVSNVAVPTITSSAYDATNGTLVLTGTGFLKLTGATNDIVANKFILTGEGGGHLHAHRHRQYRDHQRHGGDADPVGHRQGGGEPDAEQGRHRVHRRHHLQPQRPGGLGGGRRGFGQRGGCHDGSDGQQSGDAHRHQRHLRLRHQHPGGHRHRLRALVGGGQRHQPEQADAHGARRGHLCPGQQHGCGSGVRHPIHRHPGRGRHL
jgi:hypothetical protein